MDFLAIILIVLVDHHDTERPLNRRLGVRLPLPSTLGLVKFP